MPERALLSYRRRVFTAFSALSVVLVSVAVSDPCADDSGIRSLAGSQRDGCCQFVAPDYKSFEAAHANSGSRFLDGHRQWSIWALFGDDSLRSR